MKITMSFVHAKKWTNAKAKPLVIHYLLNIFLRQWHPSSDLYKKYLESK